MRKERSDMNHAQHLLTPPEMAARYGVSVRTLLSLARSGAIPAPVRLNQRVLRFDPSLHPAPVKAIK
jgi:predicted DNA-binding transcriptional regulator AlpA